MTGSRVSLEPSVLRVGSSKEEDVLLGSTCKRCQKYFFPPRARCAACTEPVTESVDLGKEGTLFSYTVMTRKTQYALVQTPYILGEVLMPQGIRIYSYINVKDAKNLKLGQRLKLDTLEIKKNEDGSSVIAYSFVPRE
ncbi:MAG: OB-fold domain-containing protein [Chloroflexi bacterium]|nr:OB-fold domain-containing protein [Chloroflexota bacterium]